jgi:hypothetical protein
MNRLCSATVALLITLVTAGPAFAIPIGVDDFEDGTTQGWFVPSFMDPHPVPPANVPTGGPSGAGDAFLRLTALGGTGAGSRLSVLNVSQWTGNYLAAGIPGIAMHVNNFGSTDLVLRLLVVNFSPEGPPSDLAWTLAPVNVPANSGWTSVVFSLSPANLFTPPIFGTTLGALSDVNELRLFHNPVAFFGGPEVGAPPVSAVLGVDNIQVVPELSTLLLVGSGIAGVRALNRRGRGRQE